MGRLWSGTKRVAAVMTLAALPAALGCGAFFQCEGKTSCKSTTSGTDSGDVVFAANQNSTGIYAYYISSGTMYTVAGEPFATSFVPSAMVVNTANTYLFVATATGYIYDYAVSSTGVLSGIAQQASTSLSQVSMDVSSDGKWLIALDGGTTTPTLKVYSISGGTLTIAQPVVNIMSTSTVIAPGQVKFSPKNDYVAVALGAGGTALYNFTTSPATSTVPLATVGTIIPTGSASSGDNAVAWDASENLYIGRATTTASTTGIYVVPVATLTATPTATFAIKTDSPPRSLVFASNYAYLYAANTTASSINGFSVSNAVLTSLGTSTAAPTSVNALAVDSTGLNLLSAGTSTTGLYLYTISSGALSQSNNAATGTASGAPVLAVTH